MWRPYPAARPSPLCPESFSSLKACGLVICILSSDPSARLSRSDVGIALEHLGMHWRER